MRSELAGLVGKKVYVTGRVINIREARWANKQRYCLGSLEYARKSKRAVMEPMDGHLWIQWDRRSLLMDDRVHVLGIVRMYPKRGQNGTYDYGLNDVHWVRRIP